MSSPAGAIDLGELPHGEQPELDAAWPARRRLARWRGAGGWRPWAAAAVTAVVLVTAAAAAGRPQPALVLQFTVQVADQAVAFDDQHLYVFDRQPPAGEMVLIAYRWDGTIHWRAEFPGSDYGWMGTRGGVLLVTIVPIGQTDPWPVEQTIRLDPDSGVTLWTANGLPTGVVDDLVVLSRSIVDEGDDIDGSGEYQPPNELVAVDAATGSARWSIEAQRWDYWPESAVMVAANGDSGLASYDLDTGELLATAPDTVPTDLASSMYWNVRVIGSHALVMDQTDGRWVLSTHDATTLRQQWTLTGSVTSQDGNEVWPFPCGELVCLSFPEQALRAVDPDTGEPMWTAGWAATDAGQSWYDIQYLGAAGHALLSRSSINSDDRASWLMEFETGQPILDLGEWAATAGYYTTAAGSDASILMRGDEDGTWIGRLLPDLSGVEVLGLVDVTVAGEQPGYCLSYAPYLICVANPMTEDEWPQVDLGVWRLP